MFEVESTDLKTTTESASLQMLNIYNLHHLILFLSSKALDVLKHTILALMRDFLCHLKFPMTYTDQHMNKRQAE